MNTEPFVIERVYDATPSRVWDAISRREQMKEWYFDLAEFKPEVGFEFQFVGGPPEKSYTHLCKVVEVIVGKKLKYSWQYQGEVGMSYVTFELFPEGNKTRLKLTHEGLETFPKENPHLAKENFVYGWTDLIGKQLKEYLER